MPDVPILGQNGHRPQGEMYIPGREYLVAIMLDTGDQLTAKTGFSFPPDQIPNPFVPEEVCVRAIVEQIGRQSVTRSQEGTWFAWAHVSAFTYVGPADVVAAPKLQPRPAP